MNTQPHPYLAEQVSWSASAGTGIDFTNKNKIVSSWVQIWGPFYWHELALIPAWVSKYTHYKVWDEITYSFPNFNGFTVEVW